MKKIISLVLVALLFGGVAFAAPAYQQSPGIGDIMGQGKLPSDAHKTFRLVRYITATEAPTNVATLTADAIVVWSTNSDDGVTVTTTTTSGEACVAGILPIATLTPDSVAVSQKSAFDSIGSRNWTWLQTYGPCEVLCYVSDLTGISAGQSMGTSATPGMGTGFSSAVNTVGLPAGFWLDAVSTASSTSVQVFVKCE